MRKWRMDELNRMVPSEFHRAEKLPLVLGLDDIRSALNVGSIFRTADAFALEGLALCGISARPPHREILKTALGSTDSVEWQGFETALGAIEHYRSRGYLIGAAEQAEGAVMLHQFEPPADRPCLVFLGNEVEGVSDALFPHLDFCLEIPQFGTKHSLNVGVCAGVVSWHFTQFRLS